MIYRLALPLCLLAGAAHAQSRHLEATGTALAIDSPCARAVVIQPDPTLAGKFILDARADHPEETNRLLFDSGATAKLHISTNSCEGSFFANRSEPTLDLTLRVPPATNLAIEESGGARYTIGPVGKLTLDISGGVQLDAASATDVALGLSGGAAIKLGRASGKMTVDLSGGGDIHVAEATLADLTLSISGGGAFALPAGTIQKLALDVSGAGSVRIGAPVTDATLSMSGAGDVHLASVSGNLLKDISGVGSLDIGGK